MCVAHHLFLPAAPAQQATPAPLGVATALAPQATPLPTASTRMGLKRCTAMPIERHMHGCAVVGPRIYVMGGNREVNGKEEWLDSVISAEILPSGDLGPWRDERPMPERRHYIGSSVEVVQNRIYVVGGNVAPAVDTPENNVGRAKDVLWTTVKSDGTLDEWKKSEPFPGDARACLATCSNDRHLFVLGGSVGAGITNSVLRGTFGPDNSPGDWKEIVPLATPLWFHGAAIMDDTMYVWGGLTQRSHLAINPNIYASKVAPDGTLQPWRIIGTMSHPVFSAAFCGFNDHLVCIAGRYAGGKECSGIWYTRIQNGVPTNWVLVDTDLAARVYLTLGLDKTRGWIFIPGGRYRDDLNPNGAIQRVVQAFYVPQPAGTAFKAPDSTPAPSAAGGVTPLALVEAIALAGHEKKPILVFFHSPAVPAARRVWETVSATPEFQKASQTHIWAEVDISRESNTMVYEYGVFKVPALVKLAPTGQRLGPAVPFNGVEDLTRLAQP
ncbi:MAG: hypothetical protein N2111_14305 [Candidatus Sumerlaeaceae bacterium]|nr:hypothetical protein [Candidatus Sumerlaeaceae bacterium]